MNNLEIVNNENFSDESNKINKQPNSNKNTIDSEGIPILEDIGVSYLSADHYYRVNYPEHKIIKIGSILFVKMGRLLTFNFDKSNNYIPRFSIGPHWYLTIVLFIITFSLSLLLYNTIFFRLGFIKRTIYYLFTISIYLFVLCTALIHPEIIMNKKKNSQEYAFCSICKAYYNPYDKVEHCDMCGCCFPKMDHHCVWMGKCVANKNATFFYATLVDVGIFYLYIIYCVIDFAIREGSKPKKL